MAFKRSAVRSRLSPPGKFRNLRISELFCIFCVTLENSEKVVHNAYIIACFLGCQNGGQNPDFYMIFLPLKFFLFYESFSRIVI